MAREATVNGGKNGHPSHNLLGGVGSFGTNLVSLAGLQAQLAMLDTRACIAQSTLAAVGMLLAVVLGFASLIVSVAALGLWLATAMAWPLPQSLLLVSVVFLIVAGAVVFAAIRHIRKSLVVFRRSQEELDRNLAWVKTVLAQSGR